jgi:hypothetical protein
MRASLSLAVVLLTLGVGVGCGDSDDSSGGDDQTPPTGAKAVESWLADGMYKSWAAEPAVHASRMPSPHGFNRIYSNKMISSNAAGTAPWPKGAAAVKELYASATATTPIGYSVYLKLADDSAAGGNWYWYERVTTAGAAKVNADGNGDQGTAMSYCVGCHAGAGIDADHTPTPGSRDQVYSPIR